MYCERQHADLLTQSMLTEMLPYVRSDVLPQTNSLHISWTVRVCPICPRLGSWWFYRWVSFTLTFDLQPSPCICCLRSWAWTILEFVIAEETLYERLNGLVQCYFPWTAPRYYRWAVWSLPSLSARTRLRLARPILCLVEHIYIPNFGICCNNWF